MSPLKYKIIKTSRQYRQYCSELEVLVSTTPVKKEINDEIELLTFLIEKWDAEHSSFDNKDPVALLQSLMQQRNMKAVDLAGILGISKGLVSDILNYKKGLSKGIIRQLASEFKVSQEAFNRPYTLKILSPSRQHELLRPQALKNRASKDLQK
jgi:HTH-type transcriptional regulator / antitoxin HigA